ncbi:hypothetical protein ACFX12_018086 [Malus domestica]
MDTLIRILKDFCKKLHLWGNSHINFYCKCGDLDAACSVFRQILRNVVSWNTLIWGYAFNGKGLVEKGNDLFASMNITHQIDPKLEHHGCVGALLGACSTHGEVELTELAAKELINLEPWNSRNYVLLSSIYAE